MRPSPTWRRRASLRTPRLGDGDVRHLRWLQEQIGPEPLDAVVITTGAEAYRRRDGVAVVAAALLGP